MTAVSFPPPLWGGVRGGGRRDQHLSTALPAAPRDPHPDPPHKGEGSERDWADLKRMTREHLSLFDTTLRDGQQTPGVDFSLDDKLVVMDLLDSLGVDYIEGGYPGANPTDTALFGEERKTKATFTAFGMVKRAGRSVSNDSGLQDLLAPNPRPSALSPSPGTTMCAWRWAAPTRKISTHPPVGEGRGAAGKEVLVDCEHFFDGYKANPAYALACAKTAHDSGARWVVLCDTNGGTLPPRFPKSSAP